MIVFGPLSSMSGILTFLTFRLGFHASATLLAAAGSSNRPSSSNSPSCLSRASAGPSTKANPGPALLLSSVAIASIAITLCSGRIGDADGCCGGQTGHRAADDAAAPESWPLRPARGPSNVWSVTVRSGSSVSHREIIPRGTSSRHASGSLARRVGSPGEQEHGDVGVQGAAGLEVAVVLGVDGVAEQGPSVAVVVFDVVTSVEQVTQPRQVLVPDCEVCWRPGSGGAPPGWFRQPRPDAAPAGDVAADDRVGDASHPVLSDQPFHDGLHGLPLPGGSIVLL